MNTVRPLNGLRRQRGTARVTHHFHDGVREEACVDRHELGTLDDRPRRRRVSIAWDEAPRLVLVAGNPHNNRSKTLLPTVVKFLQSLPSVVVAVDHSSANLVPKEIGIVSPCEPDAHQNGFFIKRAPSVSEGMESITLTGSALAQISEEGEFAPDERIVYEPQDVDLVITLGGDGLILHVISHLFPNKVPPFMPFGLGSMGFLTPFNLKDYQNDLTAVLNGRNNSVTMRMRLKCVVHRQPVGLDATQSPCVHNFEDNALGEEEIEESQRQEHHVLNELVIDRGPAPYLSNLEVLCDDRPVTRVQADGIIVATPTGSTAYSLSAGGSMVHPSVPAILFTPICPHSLSFRPVLFPDYVTLQIKVPKDARAPAWISFDGRHRIELRKGDKVVVSVSPWSVPTFTKKDTTDDWFASVSQCLRWNERVVQGASN